MAVHVTPTLAAMAEVYRHPRDGGPQSGRFLAYVELGRRELPVSGYNPMTSKDVGSTVEALLALDAEGLVQRTADEWAPRLGLTADVGLYVTVAAPGMWTDRLLTEIEHRFLGRTWRQVLFWYEEPASSEAVVAETIAQLVRATWFVHHGPPATAADAAGQEGLAAALAGPAPAQAPVPDGGAADAAVFDALDIVGSDGGLGTMVGLLYGDDTARQGGWTPLGLPARAGFGASTRAARRAIATHDPTVLIEQQWTPTADW